MKIINPTKYWQRLGRLIEQRANAIKHHRKHSHIEAEMRMIRTALIDWDNRRERKAA